jgi:hypothetical protein
MSGRDAEKTPPGPRPDGSPDRSDVRRAREAKALRENLRRRKAQVRAREEGRDTATESSSSDDKID